MGAVFTIFLFAPLWIPLLIITSAIEKFTGLSTEEQLEILSDTISKWVAENPETVEKIGDFLKKAFDFIVEIADKT